MHQKRIIIVIPAMTIGGSSQVVFDMTRNLSEAGFEVYVFILFNLFDKKYSAIYEYKNVNILFFNKGKGLSKPSFYRNLKKKIIEIGPSIISTHLTSVFYISNLVNYSKTKVFHTIHSYPEFDLPFVYRFLLRKKISSGKIIMIGCSENIAKMAKILYKNNVEYALNGVDIKAQINRDSQTKEFDFLFVGRFDRCKRVVDLIGCFSNVLEIHENAKMALCGDGPEMDKIVRIIDKNDLHNNVKIFSGVDVSNLYRKSSIFCLSSSREGAPITILEAMSYGLPIIAPKIGGIPEYVQEGVNGFLYDVNSLSDMTNLMIKALDRNTNIAFLSENAYLTAKKHTSEAMTRKYMEIFEKYLLFLTSESVK